MLKSAPWISCRVEDVAAASKNALVGGPFGSDLVSRDYVDFGVPVIRGQNLSLGRWVGGEFAFVSEAKADSLQANCARPGDIVFTQRGTLGQVAIVPEGAYVRYLLSQSQMKLTADPALADPLFLYYQFISEEQQEYIRAHAIQTGVPHTNLSILRRAPIITPLLEVQRAIAFCLGALDDKIEFNRRMNETLEAMARALFRSWFVDFDPVRAKSEGRPSGLPAYLDTLFPSEFEDSPLGEIPKGWLAGTVEDVAVCRRRSASTSSISHDDPYVGLEHIDKKSLALSNWGTGADVASQKSRFQAGEVLFGKLRPYFHKVCIAPVAGICSTDILVVDSREPGLHGFVILALSEESTIDFVTASSGGTRMPRTSWSDLARVPLVIPPFEVAAAFYALVAESLEHIQNSAFENQSLAAQRDFLLPKLLSGEIEVAEAVDLDPVTNNSRQSSKETLTH